MWSPHRQEGSTKIVGPAYTAQYALIDDPAPKVTEHYVSQQHRDLGLFDQIQIDGIPPGAVVFISSPPNVPNAVYGGLMSTRAQYSQAAGTVVDGRIRDVQEHRDLQFPVSLLPYSPPASNGVQLGVCSRCRYRCASRSDEGYCNKPTSQATVRIPRYDRQSWRLHRGRFEWSGAGAKGVS